jgi:hypothetical protein
MKYSLCKKLQKKTLALIEQAYAVLEQSFPQTLRQCYYQLVAKQIIPNNKNSYQRLSGVLVDARLQGLIPWDWLEDRLRATRKPSMWKNVREFADVAVRAYRRDVWATQPSYLQCWLEKDALSGIFEDALEDYGVPLNVGRGFDGWSSLHELAEYFKSLKKPVKILYFGDFDPSGDSMHKSLAHRFGLLGFQPEIEVVAILKSDIKRYNLPPDFAKLSDSRSAKFVARHGEQSCVELDALPSAVLRARLIEHVKANISLDELSRTKAKQERERRRIAAALWDIRVT